jgi:hypothetical protein
MLAIGSSADAKPEFSVSQPAGQSWKHIVCDLDGDGLKDLVLISNFNLSIFYQDRKQGFAREPQQTYRLAMHPCIVWPAKLGRTSESLVLMTSDGINELIFTNRTSAPALEQIIQQQTLIPNTTEETNLASLSFLAQSGGDWPLLLLPASDGIHAWRHEKEWRQIQVISHSTETRLRPSLINPGYAISCALNLSIGDVNGDSRDDLIVRRNEGGRTNVYILYLQQTNGMFGPEPAMIHADKGEPHTWLCWADLNRDGRVDLIKSTWLNEPSFLPGVSSGKVMVRTYFADARGRIPSEPQRVFRKSDWTAALPVLDVDGDGYPDLVLGYSLLDTREGVRKQVAGQQLDFSLRFYFYHAGQGFPQEADCSADVVIHLDQSSLLLGWDRRQYFERCVQLTGDFNGDGKTDLLVRDRNDALSVYFFISREKGFSREQDLRFNCPEAIDGWEAVDLNADGVSDLIVKLGKEGGFRIFVSQNGKSQASNPKSQ